MARSSVELYEKAKRRILSETNIKNFSPGSIARTILQVHSEQLGEYYKYVDDRILQTYVSSASGYFLDLIGELVNVQRSDATFTNGMVRFYINPDSDLTFSNILDLVNDRDGGSRTSITIPSGTTVRAGDRSYVTTSATTLTALNSEPEVEVLATLAGTAGNTDKDTVDSIVWNDSVLSILSGIVEVINDSPMESGRDTWTDAEYRYFITNATTAAAKANETAIRLGVLSVPGVSNAIIQNYAYGVGTFAVYVTSTSPITTAGTLLAVQQAINLTQAAGIRGVAVSPDLIGIQATISLEFIPTTKAADKEKITRQVQIDVIDYINNLQPGEEMVISEISQRVMDVSEEIHDHVISSLAIGDYNLTTGTIDNIDNTLSIANQTAETSQKFVSNSDLLTVCNI